MDGLRVEEPTTMKNGPRRLPRFPTDWEARFRFDVAGEWRKCRLTNISWEGASLDLEDIRDDEPLDGRIYVQIRSVSGEDEIDAPAQIRHSTRTGRKKAKVGIMFEPTEEERYDLYRVLMSLRAL
jgi:hypothetical protein